MARIDPRRAKIHYAYSVEELARLLGVCRNTVRTWHKKDGLAAIDGRRPFLFKGAAVRAFLEGRRAAARRPCPPGTLYCLKCRAARAPALGMADFVARDTGAGDLRALCETCGTEMYRRARYAAIDEILPGFNVRVMRAAPRIAGRPRPSPDCDFRQDNGR